MFLAGNHLANYDILKINLLFSTILANDSRPRQGRVSTLLKKPPDVLFYQIHGLLRFSFDLILITSLSKLFVVKRSHVDGIVLSSFIALSSQL